MPTPDPNHPVPQQPDSVEVLLATTRRARARSFVASVILALLALTALRYAFDLPPQNPLVGFWIEVFAGIATFAATPFVLEGFVKRRQTTFWACMVVGLLALILYFITSGPLQSILLELSVTSFLFVALDFAVTHYLLPAIDDFLSNRSR